MTLTFPEMLWFAGIGQLSVLIASALVPLRLDWRSQFAALPQLLRQLIWVYGGYVVLSIVSLGCVCLCHAEELADGTPLARAVCLYGAVFWGVRLLLQPFLAARPYLTTWWLTLGYHGLSVLFAWFVAVFAWGWLR